MTTIADSSAFKDGDRLLPQHQAALTLLQRRLAAPQISRLTWLDLACGRGQILVSLDDNLSLEARSKVEFWGYDLDQEYARETRKAAAKLGFASMQTKVGDLSEFHRILEPDRLFDFITLTNTVHEIEPSRLPTLLVDCLGRLTDTGTLFVYDLEKIRPPELGAVPWKRDDILRIVTRMLRAFGTTVYRPEVGRWKHKTCNGWNLQLDRNHMELSREQAGLRSATAIDETRDEVAILLRRRLSECQSTLEALTTCGTATPEEEEDKELLLFDFWSLSRAMRGNNT